MAYTPHTAADVEEMLASIGAKSVDDLFRDVPAELLLKEPLSFPSHTEFETERYFEERAAENKIWGPGKNFLGAGSYQHFIPSASLYLIQRGEFMTCYTPYQAEVSQGTLQAIFEFQSHIVSLTGLEVANASMYDGASALAEALTMAVREKGKELVYLPELLHPAYRAVCETFLREIDVEIRTIPAAGALTDWNGIKDLKEASAVVIATPNCLGGIEDGAAARALADKAGALLVACVNPTSLAILAAPGDYGADIAVGESQPLGIPMSFGGPYAGFFASKRSLMRKMPGRIIGRTTDKHGNEGFVLTLQTREQHIRREKATSNICTNQGLFALLATTYITFLGKEGLVEVAETSLARTQQLADALKPLGIERFDDAPTFHEVVLRLPISAEEFRRAMKDTHHILPGFAVKNWFPAMNGAENLLLVNCTEVVTTKDIEAYVSAARAVLKSAAVPA
ncbi:MAG TPA: aminomethyl-transferring glycine dehydrogenase subunit GcvPA [Candidatus Sumerlaeota bacterium]|nr:aminomethyl-transferring glycine dehydrogenase subunit GcvPA [Candidatus Sumerlaeota bacterium]